MRADIATTTTTTNTTSTKINNVCRQGVQQLTNGFRTERQRRHWEGIFQLPARFSRATSFFNNLFFSRFRCEVVVKVSCSSVNTH
jgi:hypothetical protein